MPTRLEAVRSHTLPKDEVRDLFDCVLGVWNANLTLREGEIFCVRGLSASGKSPLVLHIKRLIDPTAEEIHVAGRRADTMPEPALEQPRSVTIGMVVRYMALWPHRTLTGNLGFGLDVLRALSSMELDGWEDHQPDQLPGGMQQRVGLVRALAADPDILLMDDPFSAFDPLIRRQLQDQAGIVTQAAQDGRLHHP
ncbi:ATP-binding cassette domain-containing protein [Mesobaculum littorinae]|uniref:ATP-binding cassette domain-containing protein n=1 Tax=Mesobaculum littorinae TaxID=2486419 RepID=A0A438AGU2_9RHOB|nr:ATP-binding cassette domain-containing protein [Mesobaculum littorinae]RVV97912.1 ATP-binding cassette domain-containing protein [Mesobaculum littorinae]